MLEKTIISESELAAAARFGLENYTQHEIDNLSGSKKVKIAESKADIRNFVESAVAGLIYGKKMLLGKISNDLAMKIKTASNSDIDLSGYNLELRASDIRHIFDHHGNEKKEASRGQRAVTADDVMSIVDIVQSFDKVKINAENGLTFVKNTNGKINAVTLYATGNKSLSLKTMWVNRKRKLNPKEL